MQSRRIYSLAAAILLASIPSRSGWSETYFVADGGSDANPGTQAEPWATLQHAVDSIGPGDSIVVGAGTYAGCRISSSGQPAAPKILRAAPGQTVILAAPGPANRHASVLEIELFDSVVSHWIIEGLEIVNSPRHGIDVRNTHDIHVRDCRVHGSRRTGVFLAFSDHPTVEDCEIHDNGEHGIYHSNSGDFPHFRRNLVHNNAASGIQLNGDINFGGDGVVSMGVIERNRISNNGTSGGAAINLDGASDTLVMNNLLVDNHSTGIALYAIDGGEGSSRNRIYNNTIIQAEDGRWAIFIPKSRGWRSNPTGNRIKNNILYTPRLDRGSIAVYRVASEVIDSDHNIVVDRLSANEGNRIIDLARWQRLGQDRSSMLAEPAELFVDPDGGDFRLRPGSPAIDAGATLAEVETDIDGTPRPQGNGHDIGCYEGL